MLKDVEAYRSPLMTADDHAAPLVSYSFPAAGEAILTEYLLPNPHDPMQAFYCSADEQIVISQEMALQLWDGNVKTNLNPPVDYAARDFSVAFVVATNTPIICRTNWAGFPSAVKQHQKRLPKALNSMPIAGRLMGKLG
ncbi:hypothetical protein [Planococcus koreensis]|uniref:hypothetical protein n=1 Tax=Planococcus koreensis TaxID=112331 RepID=UPI0039FC24AB